MLAYNPNLKQKARQLRKTMTDSERVLWARLRRKQMLGVQFYRQKPICGYIVDFFAPRVKLVVEVDGSQHREREHAEKDRRRDRYLGNVGCNVLRVDSRQVLSETDAVLEVIYQAVVERLKGENPPCPPFEKGGDSSFPLCQGGKASTALMLPLQPS